MRKTSQDGGDTTSITSGIENEVKKSVAGMVKTKRNSIKRKVQNLSHESDDGVAEPLLQKEKDKSENLSQSAKYNKTKTEMISEKSDEKDKLLPGNKIEKSSFGGFSAITESLVNGTKESYKSYVSGTSSIHNHMNTNIFNSSDGIKKIKTPKTQMLVEIESNKQGGYSASPLIFTTAKIHTDGKTTHMEPVQVTPVPILSTAEGRLITTDTMTTMNTNACKTEDIKQSKNIQKEIVTPSSRSSNTISAISGGKNDDKITQNISNKICAPNITHTSDTKVIKGTDEKIVSTGTKIQPVMTIKDDPKIPHTTNASPNEEMNLSGSKVLGTDVNRNLKTSPNSTYISTENATSTVSQDNLKMEDTIKNKQKIDKGRCMLKQTKIDDKSSIISNSKAITSANTTSTDKTVEIGLSSVSSVPPISKTGTLAQSIITPSLTPKPSSTALKKLSNTPLTNQSVNELVLSPKSTTVETNIVNPVSMSEKIKSMVTTASKTTAGIASTRIQGNVKSATSVSISGTMTTDLSLKKVGSSMKTSTHPSTSFKNKQPSSITEINLSTVASSIPVTCENTSKCIDKPADNTVTRPGTTTSISRNVVDSKVTTAGMPTTTKTVSPVPAYSNITKTISSTSNSVSSTAKAAPTKKHQLPQSTLALQTTIATVKPSSASKSVGPTVKQSVGLSSSKTSENPAKTSTTVSSNKPVLISKSPTSSTSTPKPSLLHNQNQSQSSEHKNK